MTPATSGQVRFGEHDGAGDTGRVAGRIAESVEQAADDGQAVTGAAADAERLEFPGIEQEFMRATAVVQVGDQVQAIHAGILLGFT